MESGIAEKAGGCCRNGSDNLQSIVYGDSDESEGEGSGSGGSDGGSDDDNDDEEDFSK